MKIKVLFFGLTHDLTGLAQEHVEVADGEKLDDLRRQYERRFPRLKEMGGALLTAVNQEIVGRSWPLRDGDEVAFLPPVSGGAPESPGFEIGLGSPSRRTSRIAGKTLPKVPKFRTSPRVSCEASPLFSRMS